MGFEVIFRPIESRKDLATTVDFLSKNNPGYRDKDYDPWVQRTEYELDIGRKRGFIAINNNRVFGDVIWQPHKELSRVREIKNWRVHPDFRGRACGYFLLKQAEVEDRHEYDSLILDVRANEKGIIAILKRLGYVPVFAANMYDDAQDLVMVKAFDKQTESGLVYRAKELFLG